MPTLWGRDNPPDTMRSLRKTRDARERDPGSKPVQAHPDRCETPNE